MIDPEDTEVHPDSHDDDTSPAGIADSGDHEPDDDDMAEPEEKA